MVIILDKEMSMSSATVAHSPALSTLFRMTANRAATNIFFHIWICVQISAIQDQIILDRQILLTHDK
jgi:hypothetical protein